MSNGGSATPLPLTHLALRGQTSSCDACSDDDGSGGEERRGQQENKQEESKAQTIAVHSVHLVTCDALAWSCSDPTWRCVYGEEEEEEVMEWRWTLADQLQRRAKEGRQLVTTTREEMRHIMLACEYSESCPSMTLLPRPVACSWPPAALRRTRRHMDGLRGGGNFPPTCIQYPPVSHCSFLQ